jgi:spermidine synthase
MSPSSGLGAGNAATALKQHSASVTVVEIDPAVYDAATQYFGLPVLEPEYIFLEDARTWVRRQRSTVEALNGRQRDEALFDIVVHDCFSGGGVPRHVFTVEFWQDLKTIVQPDGVIAVVKASRHSALSALLNLRIISLSPTHRTLPESWARRNLALYSSLCKPSSRGVAPSTTLRKP